MEGLVSNRAESPARMKAGRGKFCLGDGACRRQRQPYHGIDDAEIDIRWENLNASAILMIVTVYQNQWMTLLEHDAIRTDPTRMAQGIMTGIGFLGAGVIFKEGLTVRGLTTAASIWITAAIGILVGIGFWFAAIVGAVAALIVLALFRYIESRLPSEFYAHHMLRFARDHVISEEEVHRLI
jgi:putative Mg2+ transporter-C (MgtC) family protein